MFLCEQEGSQLIMIWVSDSTKFTVYYIPILWDLARNVLLSKESYISWDHFLVGKDSGVVIDGTESGTYVDGGVQWETLSLDLWGRGRNFSEWARFCGRYEGLVFRGAWCLGTLGTAPRECGRQVLPAPGTGWRTGRTGWLGFCILSRRSRRSVEANTSLDMERIWTTK